MRLIIDSHHWSWTLILSFAKSWPPHDPQCGFNLPLPLTMCPCLFCKVWMSESVRVCWLERALLLPVWVRVLLIIGLPSATSMYLFETLMHTDGPSSDAYLTWTSPASLLVKSLTLIVSLPPLPDTLCICRPVHLSTCSCLNFSLVSSLSPVTVHTHSLALFHVPSSDIH